jgi:hypothetical protein
MGEVCLDASKRGACGVSLLSVARFDRLYSRRRRFAVAQGVQMRNSSPEIAGIWRMLGKMTRVILIEFNELCPRLLDFWMAVGHLPNFKNFYEQSQVFITEADETDHLEPWIQWYSIHTGLPYREHGVFHLTDGPRAGHADIWNILHGYGKRVWNCSSMNARGFSFPGSAFLPDPWCTTESAYPVELETFRHFVAHYVQEYSNPDMALGLWDKVQFTSFMATHGLRSATVSAMVRQFASELATPGEKWRRVSLLDKLQFDLFRNIFIRLRPDFSSFFVNSTAHLQHAYWRHMEPEAFIVHPPPEEIDKYKNAILFGYQEMDSLLGKFIALAGKETQLVFATALSQQPYTKYESIGGHRFYRPRDVIKFLAILGISADRIQPVMTHQYLAFFENDVKAAEAKEKLSCLTFDGKPVIEFVTSEPRTLYFGNQVHTFVEQGSRILIADDHSRSFDFYELFYRIDEIKSGRHHPDGCLWIKTGNHYCHEGKVSILDIMPTILAMYGLPTNQLVGSPLRTESTSQIA